MDAAADVMDQSVGQLLPAVRDALDAGLLLPNGIVAVDAELVAAANPGFSYLAAAADHARGLLSGDGAALERAAGRHHHPWARASTTEDLGVLMAATDHAASRANFELAFPSYEQIGASRDAARIRARLRDVGVRRRHWTRGERPVSGWASLTETECHVADIVAEGLTNAQVADRMFLSRHTVDFHLRQIFRRLTISSRVELTRLAIERDSPSQ
jgi:DNA-binding CsgD family transcriptional regulator